MKKILSFFAIALLPFSTMAEHHGPAHAEVAAAAEAFNTAYATNDVDTYFGFYTKDAVLFFFGARQPVATYREEWTASIEAGGGVEKNETSDIRIQMMPSGDVAVVSSFVDNRTRSEGGETSTVKAYETDIWQKIDSKWRVVGLHYSEFEPSE
ncbi:MAG: nuclear transport factor 2 family protein [Halieaceae bacterium]|jgi:ketosteroid isomerase-like protein|nr:nuclear transport factor 2 family protein [Halieaceae bacterium]